MIFILICKYGSANFNASEKSLEGVTLTSKSFVNIA